MRKFVKSVAAFLCAVSLLGAMSFPAAAEAKAGEGDSGVLVYQPENLSWNGELLCQHERGQGHHRG